MWGRKDQHNTGSKDIIVLRRLMFQVHVLNHERLSFDSWDGGSTDEHKKKKKKKNWQKFCRNFKMSYLCFY